MVGGLLTGFGLIPRVQFRTGRGATGVVSVKRGPGLHRGAGRLGRMVFHREGVVGNL